MSWGKITTVMKQTFSFSPAHFPVKMSTEAEVENYCRLNSDESVADHSVSDWSWLFPINDHPPAQPQCGVSRLSYELRLGRPDPSESPGKYFHKWFNGASAEMGRRVVHPSSSAFGRRTIFQEQAGKALTDSWNDIDPVSCKSSDHHFPTSSPATISSDFQFMLCVRIKCQSGLTG